MAIIDIEIKNARQIKAAFSQSPALMTKNLNKAIRQVIFFVQSKAVPNAPAVTGNLRGSVYTNFGVLKGEVGFKAFYAVFVHDGTRPHVIMPKNKKALFWQGASHPVKAVNHPGNKANPFLEKAVDDSDDQINRFFVGAVDDTLRTIAEASG